jgi:hypothetical protein
MARRRASLDVSARQILRQFNKVEIVLRIQRRPGFGDPCVDVRDFAAVGVYRLFPI